MIVFLFLFIWAIIMLWLDNLKLESGASLISLNVLSVNEDGFNFFD